MKILMLCDVLFPQTTGGAGRAARELARALRRAGAEIEFLTRARPGGAGDGAIPTTYYPPPGRSWPRVYRRLFRERVAAFRPDVVHVHQPLPAFLSIPRAYGGPILYTFYSPWPDELLLKRSAWPRAARRAAAVLYRAIERRALAAAAIVTVLSEYSRADLRRLYGREAVLIPGGVDSARFRPREAPGGGGASGEAPKKVRLITLRNLVPRMGLDGLVEAMRLLPDRFELDIGGDGPLRGPLQERISELGLAARVRLRGHVPDEALPDFYARADWFVLPTAALEGFGLVTLESLACGTPVLGTRVGATPELLERFDPRWVIPAPDAKSIASTVAAAIDLPRPPREELHRRVSSEFDWSVIGGRYLELYRTLRA